jgi:membrane-associated phospholipid phosphatase
MNYSGNEMSKKSLILLIAVLILFSLYLPIDAPRGQLYQFKTFFDDWIPLLTIFAIVYISYAVFLVISLVYFFKQSVKVLDIILLSIIISCAAAYFMYLFFQNYIERPEIVVNNIFDTIYVWGNTQVPPYNAFPSLHVAISTICTFGFWKVKSKLFKPMFIWAILIIFSTVLTKQHYFLDVVSGFLLGIISFELTKKYLEGRNSPK